MKVILQWACVLLLSGAGNAVFAATVNLPPTISGQPATVVTANTAYSFTPTADDPEKARLTFTIKGKPTWASFNKATGALTGKPTGKQAITYSNIVITVSDGRNSINLPTFSIQVNNPAPTLTGTPADRVLANQAYSFTPSVSDPNNDPLVFTIVKKPVWATFNTKTGALTGTPKSSQAALYKDILIKVLDGKNTVSLQPFTINVENPAPTISGAPQTIVTVGAAYSFVPTASDANNDTLTFTIKNKPQWATFNTKTGALTGTPTAKYLGSKSQITISVSDGRNIASLNTFELAVTNSNTPPTISGTPVTSIGVGASYSFTPIASDVDAGDVLTFSINDQKPAWATFDTATGELSGTPSATGVHAGIVISVTDGKSPPVALNPFSITVLQDTPITKSGEAYTVTADFSSPTATFELQGAPVGMSINEKTGVVTWQPDSSEVGSYAFTIIAKENGGTVYSKAINLQVELGGANPTDAFYVVPNGQVTSPTGALGSIGNPYTTLTAALIAASNSATKRTVYVRGGRYPNTAVKIENINGSKDQQIILTRLPGERVKFLFSGLSAFEIEETASYLVFDGFEIDGQSVKDHWDMLANNWWDPRGDRTIGGGQGFNVDGQHITIKNNVIHDVYQKGVNIYKGRYVNVQGNVIYNVGHSSLSGGHGIMRKWERNYHINPTDGKDLGVDVYDSPDYQYRFDITGNLLLAVEQRLYSRVLNKGYSFLTIDEGKPMLIDETQDSDPKSRISHNLVLFGGIDHIRLKQNPNMAVHNNSVLPDLSRNDIALDGMTDKTKLKNLQFYGNLVASNDMAIDVADSFGTVEAGESPVTERKYDNYIAGGGTFSGGLGGGITNLGGTDASSLFANVANQDFSSLISGAGVSDDHLRHLFELVREYGIAVKPSGWQHNHLKNAEYLMKNIPSAVFDRSTYYIGASSIEAGHQAIYLKFIDGGKWLYTKLEEEGTTWSGLTNPNLTDATMYGLPNVKIQKCNTCKGAYVYQLVLPHEWFDTYGNAQQTDFTVTNADGSVSNVVYLKPLSNPEHKNILDYSAAGKVKSY